MSLDHLLVTLFFLLPGFVALRVYEWLVATRTRSAFELTAWSLALSFVSAAPLAALERTRGFMVHLWEPTALSRPAFVGVTLQLAVGLLVGVVLAFGVTKVFRGRLGRKSFYERAWDWLWSKYGGENRAVAVQTAEGFYLGVLEFAEDPSVGRSVVLRFPRIWHDDRQDFFESGAELMYIPGERIYRVEVSHEEEG